MATHPIHTNKARQTNERASEQVITYRLQYDTVDSGTVINVEGIGPGVITDVSIIKATDFNAGTSAVVDIGLNYRSSTTDVVDCIVDGHDLSSSTALGVVRATMADHTEAVITEPANLTIKPIYSGAQSAGDAVISVRWTPASEIHNWDG